MASKYTSEIRTWESANNGTHCPKHIKLRTNVLQ
jgi:hypothetical protein